MGVVRTKEPNGPVTRAWKLGKLGLGLTGSYLGYQFQNLFLGGGTDKAASRKKSFHTRSSRRIRQELESLKGPMMKFGQILSMQTQALPPEAIAELSHLQMRAPGMHATLARAQFKAALGKYPDEVYKQFEPEPFAAASLGQVHRAITQAGEPVAVKIQYPAIRTAIENDFKILRSAALPGRISGHLPKLLFDEIQRGFMEETDYLKEAASLELFAEKLRPLPWVTIPRVHRELSGDRVLTMSRLGGLPLPDFVASHPSRTLRNLIGLRMLILFHFQRLGIGVVHADPHSGNYLFDSEGNIGLVDFGCTKRLSANYAELIHLFMDRIWAKKDYDSARLSRLVWGKGVKHDEPRVRKALSASIAFSEMVFPEPSTGNPMVDFGDDAVVNGFTGILTGATLDKLGNPEFAFHARSELGFYNLLHQLGARVNTTEAATEVMRLVEIREVSKIGAAK